MEFGKKHMLIWGPIFLLIVGMVLSIHQLYVMAAILALLAPASWLMARGTLDSISARREAPGVMKEGEQRPVRLTVTNDGLRRRYFFTVADHLPDGLRAIGDEATLVPSLASDEEVEVEYVLEAVRRGVYAIGPVTLRNSDIIGLYSFARPAGESDDLVVHPTPERLPETWMRVSSIRALQQPRRRFRGEGTEFYGTRRFVNGDDLRRVDWKSTARRGHLIVREYERAEAQDCTIALDLARGAHSGEGDDSTLERGVKLAASMAAQMIERGSRVGLIAAGERDLSVAPSADPRQKGRILDALARVQADSDHSLTAQVSSRMSSLGASGLVAIISPTREPSSLNTATMLRDLGCAVVWMTLAAPWRSVRKGELEDDQLAVRLASRGVRSYVVEPGQSLAAGMRRAYRVG